MSGLFGGLEIGKRALATHQLWLNTIGHNIANVNTPGYTRQRVTISTTYPLDHRAGQIGTGVTATDIRNVRDLFLNDQYRQEQKNLGRWASLEKTLIQIEAVFAEPNADSLGNLLDNFWASWSDLANNPESIAARTALKEQTNMLNTGFNRINNRLYELKKSVNNEINLLVDKVNNYSTEIAELNKQVVRAELGGGHANDLRDRRDYLIDQLASYIDVNTQEQKNGAVIVYCGALTIVDELSPNFLDTKATNNNGVLSSEIVWANSDKVIKNYNGELKALFDIRDEIVPGYVDDLDEIAKTLITEVNSLHATGFGLDGSTGVSFFDEDFLSAGTIRLSQEIERDVTRIAASLSGEVGDNSNANAIADLRYSLLLMNGTATIAEFYTSLIGKVGAETSKAIQLKEDYNLLVEQLDNARQGVQGVSLDEEMVQMIKYQHAFDAAARVITTMDQALETVINGMGVVGR